MEPDPVPKEADETNTVAMPVQRRQVVMMWFVLSTVNLMVWVMLIAIPATPLAFLIVWAPPLFTAMWFYIASEGAWANARGIRAVVFRETWVPWSVVSGIRYFHEMGSILVDVQGSTPIRVSRSQRFPSKKQAAAAEVELLELKRLRAQAVPSEDAGVVRRWRWPTGRQWLFVGCSAGLTLLLAAI